MSSDASSAAVQPSRELAHALLALGVGTLLISDSTLVPEDSLLDRVALPLRTAVLLALMTWLLHRASERWAGLGLHAPKSPWRTLKLVLGGYVLIALLGSVLIGLVFPALGWSGDTTFTFSHLRGDFAAYLYWLVIAWTCAAIGEEMIFRGFLFTRLERLFGARPGSTVFALVAQGVLFGLSHAYQGLSGIVLTGVTGLILGLVYLASSRNLIVCILLHALVDTISLTAIFLGVL